VTNADTEKAGKSSVVVSFRSATGVPPVNGHGQDGRGTANDTTTLLVVLATLAEKGYYVAAFDA
jgi:hypothetical protein